MSSELCPQLAVPDPCVVQRCQLCLTAEKHDLLASCVIGRATFMPRSWTNVFLSVHKSFPILRDSKCSKHL